MKTIKQTLFSSMTLALATCCASAAYAGVLQQVQVGQAGAGQSSVRLKFDAPTQPPKAFELQNPPRIVFDFPSASVVKGLRRNSEKAGIVQGVDIAGSGNKARVVARLSRTSSYTLKHEGKDIVIVFNSGTGAAGNTGPAAQSGVMKPVRSAPVKTVNYTGSSAKPGWMPKPVGGVPLAEVPAPQLAAGQGYNWYNDPNKPKPAAKPAPRPVPAARPVAVKPAPIVPAAKPVPAASLVPHNQGITQQAVHGQLAGYGQVAPQYASSSPTSSMPYRPGMTVRSGANATNNNTLRGLDFRRESAGGGRIVLTLPRADIKVDADKAGNTLKLTVRDVDVPGNLRKRMNVLDFATPVTTINTTQRGMDGLVTVLASQGFKHRVERNRNVVSVYIDKIAESKKKLLPGEKEKKNFKGDKLSLNFQDIEVRAVLQLLADFTDKNIVVSDSVAGSITVRLKDVPWDQALDIVLESKNLGMRENGNVIWVAPATELEAKEAKVLELAKRKTELAPLITEYVAINFAKASELAALIEQRSTDKNHSLLSERGSVSWDERTNTLLVQDTVSRVEDIRDLIKVLDVPVQQVLIESRIVIANDEFGKELGARFGITPARAGSTSLLGLGNLGDGSDTFFDSLSDDTAGVTIPGLNDRLSVNLPVTGAAGSFGFSILSPDFMLDLELSALQADSKGEIVSTPRVITSNQKKAVIEQGVEIPYLQASSSGATNVAFKKAVLSLEVTPQITPDEHVSMDLKVNQDTVGQIFNDVPSINTREVQTNVLVGNGQTVVLGGVHEEETLNGVTKVPVLGDLPVVGRMFRTTNNSDKKRELLIFVTPKIVDAKQ